MEKHKNKKMGFWRLGGVPLDASWAENNFAGPVASISVDFHRFSTIFIDFH